MSVPNWQSIASEEKDFQCPHCYTWHEAVGVPEDDEGSTTCIECSQPFIVEVEYQPIYTVTKI